MKNTILILFCLFALTSCGQNKSNAEFSGLARNKVDSLFYAFNNLDSPGYAIGISKNGKTLYKNGYGVG